MSNYLQYLIWLILFVIVIEMIFPDSSYRKYIKLVLGCILVYTMLKPIVGLIHVNGADYETYVNKYIQLFETDSIQREYGQQVQSQQGSIEDLYRTTMKQYIEQQFDVSVKDINLQMDQGEIQRIDLVVGKKEDKIKVGSIHIGSKSKTIDGEEEQLKNKIKTCLSNFYYVQVKNIYITVQKN